MKQENYYEMTQEEVIKDLHTSNLGLDKIEAEKRNKEEGLNKLKEGKKESILKKFIKELLNPMLIVLMVAAALSVISSALTGKVEYTDALIILIVVLINAILGVYQEAKAEKAIEALQKMSASISKVRRNGKIVSIQSEKICKGDIVLLEAGDSVPADGRIIISASLKCEEAALTGESVPSEKNEKTIKSDNLGVPVPLADRQNMVYMGTNVVYGRGEFVVTEIGMSTEMGKIASALDEAENNETPLQKRLNSLSKILTWAVLGISVFIFCFSLLKLGLKKEINLPSVLSVLMIAVSLAVAAIPEGLAAVVTIVLSLGVTKMSKRNAIIRKLTAVETLGSTETICSDKTGTLTQNKMTVVESFSENKKLLAKALALCSDAYLDDSNNAKGEPTEVALVNFAFNEGINKTELEKEEMKRVAEIPFDSERKMMSTFHNNGSSYIQFIKGAPDEVLKKCTKLVTTTGVKELTEKERETILEKNKSFASRALRVLAAAYKDIKEIKANLNSKDDEKDLIFIGLVGMIDPIRPEVKEAIKLCHNANIRPVMITGDHKDTAFAIAKELGISKSEKEVITGNDLDLIKDAELEKNIKKYSVYARVKPEHKVRIVKAWQNNDSITAMTGDGVNDAPAIKSADIGIGMGITGTDVTKNVADMVLRDDNFATIVVAVEEGRRIYDNIRKAVSYLLSSNLAEVISVFISSMMGFTLLSPAMLLWINLITDCFPAVGLGVEKAEENVMNRKPRKANEGIFARGLGINILIEGILLALITLLSYIIGEVIETGTFSFTTSKDGMTMAFLTLSLAEMFHSFNKRSEYDSLFKKRSINKFLVFSLLGAFVLTILVIYIPFLRNAFGFSFISFKEFIIAILIALTIIPLVELTKFIERKIYKNKNA